MAGIARAQCEEGETAELLCYTDANGSTPHHVDAADVKYVAQYLRAYGGQTRAGRQFTMTAADAPFCDEWTLYAHGTVLATAKHLDSSVNSSVLFSDIANTIDGGASASDEEEADALIGCDSAGGSLAVQFNESNPQYNTEEYLANNYTPHGILIKIINSGA